jgi:hypothetical protein
MTTSKVSTAKSKKYELNEVYDSIAKKISYIITTAIVNPINKEIDFAKIYNSRLTTEEALIRGLIHYNKELQAFIVDDNTPEYVKQQIAKEYGASYNDRSRVINVPIGKLSRIALIAIDQNISKNQDLLGFVKAVSGVYLSNLLLRDVSKLFENEIDKIVNLSQINFQNVKDKDAILDTEYETIRQTHLDNIKKDIFQYSKRKVEMFEKKLTKEIDISSQPNLIKSIVDDVFNKENIDSASMNIATSQGNSLANKSDVAQFGKYKIRQFKWGYSSNKNRREFHEHLANESSKNGVLYDYDNPPVDPKTGIASLPGELNHCRCHAIWYL